MEKRLEKHMFDFRTYLRWILDIIYYSLLYLCLIIPHLNTLEVFRGHNEDFDFYLMTLQSQIFLSKKGHVKSYTLER